MMTRAFMLGLVLGAATGAVVGAAVRAPGVPGAESTVTIPFSGSVKDDAGTTWSVSGTQVVTKTEPVPPVPPVPVGMTFGPVTDIFGAPIASATSGKVLRLTGTGFPMTNDEPPIPPASLRLVLAEQSMGVQAWTHTSIQWGIPNSLSDRLTAPLTGGFKVYRQIAGTWTLLGQGGRFTIMPPSPPPPAAARKR